MNKEIERAIRIERNEVVDMLNEHIDADAKNVDIIEDVFKNHVASIKIANENFIEIVKRLNKLEQQLQQDNELFELIGEVFKSLLEKKQ